MTTTDLDRLRAPRAGLATRGQVATLERRSRLKRLILAGALGSFLALFGLTVAQDQQSQPVAAAPPATTSLPSGAAAGGARQSVGGVQLAAPRRAAQPKVRTSSS
ncbi:MAG TPA: hypothetical protein VFI42_05515 [Thermomicrobiaceae bacterium]|nr:hypothetical protein [Thermomicrobiaceae bacterium]